jgi:Superfamily I DNA and RNA helicases
VSDDLNPEQRAAVQEIDGPLLVIAGPGAGKTKTLVERIVHLIVDKKVPSESILIATFTEKAAKELVTRVSNRAVALGVDINLTEMYIGTLHSIFLRIIEEHRPKTKLLRNYRVLDSFEQQYLIHRSLQSFHALEGYSLIADPAGPRWEQAEAIAKLVNKAAEEDLSLERLRSSESELLRAYGILVEKYRGLLHEENALDFSTIQSTLLELLRDYSDVLEELRKRIRYIMVDEYQDTNAIQEKIMLMMAAPSNNICVVGDDDQSLYRFRGATVQNILEFQKNFAPDACRKIELTTNYRSHPGIVDFYNRWMTGIPAKGSWIGDEGQSYRDPKVIQPQDAVFKDYASVAKVVGQETQDSWNDEVLSFVESLKAKSILKDYNQIAFLFRSVKSEKAIKLASFLEEHGIPVFSPRSALFFEREEVRLLLGAFSFMFPNLVEKYLKWQEGAELKEWKYYEDCLSLFTAAVRENRDENATLLKWCAQKAKFHTEMRENANYGFASLFYELLAFPMFSRYLDVDLAGGAADLRPIYNLALFSQLLAQFEFLHNIIVLTPERLTKDLRALFNQYFRFLIDGGIAEYEDFEGATPPGCVSFMTIHQSKGLEFPIVLVDSLNSVPTRSDEDIDKELAAHYRMNEAFEPVERIKYFDFWRLYYTAFSRARDFLALSGAENRQGKGRARLPSSSFLALYDGLPDWRDTGILSGDVGLSLVAPPAIKHEYAFTSHILLYENCPRQYMFFRELEFSPVRTNAILFGTLVHQTIEDVHKTVLAGEADRVTPEQLHSWLNTNYASISKATRTYLAPNTLAAVYDHIERYVNRASRDWSVIEEAELRVALVKEEYILTGSIDLLQGADGSVEIVDFKTEKKPDINEAKDREKLERYRRQLEVYAHIVEERYGRRVSRMHLYYTGAKSENPYISYDFEKRKIDKTIETIGKVVDRIEAKSFSTKGIEKTDKHCRDCDVRPFCWNASLMN